MKYFSMTFVLPVRGCSYYDRLTERIMQSLYFIDKQPRGEQRLICQVDDYCMPNLSDKVVRKIHSYIDYLIE
ncbi:hypothetical protein OAP20_09175 [Alphaproteobacteria bacterium]|nr:hypothetical protein [Alphaproteobacteria bacterium]